MSDNIFSQEDRDLLIRLDEKVNLLMKNFDNHLAHHKRWFYIIGGALISSALSTLIAVVKLI